MDKDPRRIDAGLPIPFDDYLYGLDWIKRPDMIWPDNDVQSERTQKLLRVKHDNASTYWRDMCEILEHDFNTLPLEQFKHWASIRSIPLLCEKAFKDFIGIVKECVNEHPAYKTALYDPLIGCSKELYENGLKVFSDFQTSMNKVCAIAHLRQGEYNPELLANVESIVELGGGIGDMANVVYDLGFKGTYTIYDFDVVGKIQKWYNEASGHPGIRYVSKVEDLKPAQLCISTFGFTEMPFDLREKILNKLGTDGDWLLAYSQHLLGLDNAAYIKDVFLPKFKRHFVRKLDIPCMNWDGGSRHLYCKAL